MNNKLIKGSLAGVACLALAAGSTTFAAWTDFGEVLDNEVGAGILKLNLAGGNANSTEDGFHNVRLAPGIGFDRVIYVASSDGDSVPNGDLTMKFADFSDIEGNGSDTGLADTSNCTTNSESEAESGSCGNDGEFWEQAHILMRYSDPYTPAAGSGAESCDPQVAGTENRVDSNIQDRSEFLSGVDLGTLAPGEGVCVHITIDLPYTSTTDASQGDSVGFDMRFDLDQV